MSKVDVAVIKEPLQLVPLPNLDLGKRQVAGLEEMVVGDDKNPEFKLPKTSPLVVVLMTNVLMQVIPLFLPAPPFAC